MEKIDLGELKSKTVKTHSSLLNDLLCTFPYLNPSQVFFGDFCKVNKNVTPSPQLNLNIHSESDILWNQPLRSDSHTFYNYDMTYYITRKDLRLKDSTYMAKIFTQQWSLFKTQTTKHNYIDYMDIPFRDTFHGSRRCFNFLKTPEQIFTYYFTLCEIAVPECIPDLLTTSIQIVIPFFSHIKAYIHNNIDTLPPISYCYSELDTIAGYPKTEHRALNDDPVDWLSRDVADMHSADWWAARVYAVLLRHRRPANSTLLSFEEFLRRPWLWVTDGASSVSRLKLDDKIVKTKFGAALSLNLDQLIACVLHAIDKKSINIDIFVKPDERGFKRRLIANMDLGSYLIAAYVRYLIEWLDGPTPHWMTATTKLSEDKRVVDLLRLHKRSIPLDESQFDHHLSRAAWLGFLRALDCLYPENLGVYFFHLLFSNSKFFSRETGQRGFWLKGMPSGLAITSMGNTLFNFIKQNPIYSPIHFALGDDVLLFNQAAQLDELSAYYQSFGAEINIKKNWTSNQYAEFLHFLYCRHGRVGIPARMYGSLVYGLQFSDTSPLQRVNELATMFKDFFDRACVALPEQLVAADLSRAVSQRWAGFSAKVAMRWLHIPKALNGFGRLPYDYTEFRVNNLKTREHRYTNSVFEIPSIYEVVESRFELIPFNFRMSPFRTGAPLRLPEIQTFEQWKQRLNFEVPGLSALQVKFAADTIPLPELDFVSTSRMSNFAANYRFYAAPNLHGSRERITRRFISASLVLAAFVKEFMNKEHWLVYV